MSDNTHLPQCWQDFNAVIEAGIDRVILYGPPGTGKTFAGLNMGDVSSGSWRLVCTEDMTNFDVTGGFLPGADGSFEWHDGSAVSAWRGNGITGGRLVVDEIDKAGGDVFATLLAMTDTVESAKWENPATGRIEVPKEGFSVIMTTNIENMEELPSALKDRFPCAIRINEPQPDIEVSMPLWQSGKAEDPDELVVVSHNWDEVRRCMWDYVSIVRTRKRLLRGQSRIENLREEIRQYYWDFKVTADLLELRNIAQVAEIIIACALQRPESRGLHYNLDCPGLDETWAHRDTIIQRELGPGVPAGNA